MIKKNKKSVKIGNLAFPEGGMSATIINKINEIYLSRALEEDGHTDLMQVLVPFSEGKILEHAGQMKKARETFQGILKKNPRNKWAQAALKEIERNLH
jgi:predicted Zn-dependent protease